MHYAYPPRKATAPPRFTPRSTRFLSLRRNRLKVIAIAGLTFITIIYLFLRRGRYSPPKERAPSGRPPVVLVTVFDESNYKEAYLDTIRENRRLYAEKHGERLELYCLG
jgi:mannan polymerase II complex MNN11 subunit